MLIKTFTPITNTTIACYTSENIFYSDNFQIAAGRVTSNNIIEHDKGTLVFFMKATVCLIIITITFQQSHLKGMNTEICSEICFRTVSLTSYFYLLFIEIQVGSAHDIY